MRQPSQTSSLDWLALACIKFNLDIFAKQLVRITSAANRSTDVPNVEPDRTQCSASQRNGTASVRGGRCDGGARRSDWRRITGLRRDVGAEAPARGADGRWPVPGWGDLLGLDGVRGVPGRRAAYGVRRDATRLTASPIAAPTRIRCSASRL